MRVAWKLSEEGYPILWRHFGHVLRSYHLPLIGEQRLIICFDEIAYEENLTDLISDLTESGLPFVLLGSARKHDWENSELRSSFQRMAHLQEFQLDRLQKNEVEALLECLDRAKELGALASLSPDRRVSHFLDRLEADGQLLPALLTARRGQSFEQILKSVFEDLSKRHGKETADFLLRGYAGIALVHRFNFGMTRPLLAGFVSMTEDKITPRLLHPLQGELLDISTGEEQQLSTRHPWIAEAALGLLCGRYLPEETYLYHDLYRALGGLLQSNPLLPERKLLGMLPLAFKRRGETERARQLFKLAAEVDPKKAHTFQAWALMEKEQGNYERALSLFSQAAQADPNNAFVYLAWALMEKEQGDYDRARELFQRAAQANPKDPVTFQAWALMEKGQGNRDLSRELFQRAAQANPKDPVTFQSWALMEKEQGDYDRARELFKQAALADPKHAPVYQAWALMEARHGDDRTAQKILERGLKCVSKRQGQALILSTFGSLLARRKEFALAKQFFGEALGLNEADPLTHYHFAVDCLLPEGDEEEACQHLHQALELGLRKESDRRRIQRALEQHCKKQL